MFDKDLTLENFVGKVIYNEDPDFSGRCKVRVFGLFDELDDSLIPWFTPQSSAIFSSGNGGGSLSVPKIGTFVRVKFANNDFYSGEYTNIQNVDPFLVQILKGDDKTKSDYGEYTGSHVICYDSEQNLLVLFQPYSGLTMYYKESIINIGADTIVTLKTPNDNATITLDNDNINITTKATVNITSSNSVTVNSDNIVLEGNTVDVGKDANVPAVNGEALFNVLSLLATEIESKQPSTFGKFPVSLLKQIYSNTVKISK
jgi:hypothetical protein